MEVAQIDTTTTYELPLELTKAIEKADKLDARAVKAAGYGASDLALVVTKGSLGIVTEHVRTKLAEQQHPNTQLEAAFRIITGLDPSVLALVGLSVCLHGVALGENSAQLFMAAGVGVARECWAHGLLKYDPKLAARIEKETRVSHSNTKQRYMAARGIARRAGYTVSRWSNDRTAHVGCWLVDCVVAALPDVFEWITQDGEAHVIALRAEALAQAEQAITESILRNPVFLPLAMEPPPWTSWRMSHPDPRINYGVTFLRTFYNDVAGAAKAAIADGSMKPALDGVTALQSVPWRINTRVLAVLKECVKRNIEVPGLPSPTPAPMPPRKEVMSELEQNLWRLNASEVRRENRTLLSERLMLSEDTQIADYCASMDRWWTPMNCDWRGRVYPLCHFNFQREDRVRALFQFADGEPIGEEGLWWLKVHVANCGDFDKISKRPLEERVAWVDDNCEMLTQCGNLPLVQMQWTKADKPFLFLAACMELTDALRAGPQFVTTLPVSFDGSCSGLQHLAAMTHDEQTASLVNLTPSSTPQDVYQTIADAVNLRVQTDAHEIAKPFLAHGIDRKTVKRNVMTYSYSSKKFGMATQQQTDLMDPLARDVLRGKLAEHPFAPYHKGSVEKPGRAARYIASHVFDAIEQTIHKPAQVMQFLQKLAKALAHEGKPVRWKTPTGIPWINRYQDKIVARLRLYLHDRGVKSPTRVYVTVGNHPTMAKDKASNGIAPNFVHALDAAHLVLTVNACVAEGLRNIATVHDSFGCLASRSQRFNEIIREVLVRMYTEHDVLAEVLDQASRDLTQHTSDRMPNAIQHGNLNLKDIINAAFAFA